jgi:drug/metabolite transporter (DMT)-like permease
LKNLFLFLIPTLIWGSTWYAIKFQLGVVDPVVSVVYRFFLAGMLLLGYCKIRGVNLKFSVKDHIRIIVQGVLLFGINYWLVYYAETFVPSGLVAIIFSTIVFMNSLNGYFFLKSKINIRVLTGGLLGIVGSWLLFDKELSNFTFANSSGVAILIAFVAAYFASLGNITSAYNQTKQIPVMQSNGFAMLYGAASMFLVALFLGKEFTFHFNFEYGISLFYLSVFGSIIAFGAYLTLIGNIGADRAAYVAVIAPVIALVISTVFENYQWSLISFAGALTVLVGNVIALTGKKHIKTKQEVVCE